MCELACRPLVSCGPTSAGVSTGSGCHQPTVPRSCEESVHTSVLRSSSEFLRLIFRPPPFGCGASCQAFLPHRDNTRSVHLSPGFRPWLRSVLRLSQPLDGLLRSTLRGLISSRSHVQVFFRSGVSLPPQPPSLSGGASPLPFPAGPSPGLRPRPVPSASTSRLCSALSHVPSSWG
jgi:hypothetical protein